MDKNDVIVLDIREQFEYALGEIPGAVKIPLNSLRERLSEIDKDKLIVPFCQIGIRAYIAGRILVSNGFKVRNLAGGYNSYKVFTEEDNNDINPENVGKNKIKETINSAAGDYGDVKLSNTIKLDSCGLQCPGPILAVYNKIKEINDSDILEVSATDPGFCSDAKSWCEKTGNTFIKSERKNKEYVVWIQKGNKDKSCIELPCSPTSKDGKTIVVFSGDLDKAIASFIIANGSAAMGKKVTMFFTFWGLNILRKSEVQKIKKSPLERMFGMMMPRGASRLKLSKMNMMGLGGKMIKHVMKKKNVSTLDELIDIAKKNGVNLVACTMSMEIMGIKEEELIEGVNLEGVASYLGAAEYSNLNLFV